MQNARRTANSNKTKIQQCRIFKNTTLNEMNPGNIEINLTNLLYKSNRGFIPYETQTSSYRLTLPI